MELSFDIRVKGKQRTPINSAELELLMNYLSNAGKTKMLRSEIKTKLGLNCREVSVTSSGGSYDSSINVYLKTINAITHYQEVEKLALKFKHIDYDPYCGEVLCGGNTYVNVSCDRSLLREFSTKYLELATQVYNELTEETGGKCVLTINGLDFHYIPKTISHCYIDGMCFIDTNDRSHKIRRIANSVEDIAFSMAQFELCGYFFC